MATSPPPPQTSQLSETQVESSTYKPLDPQISSKPASDPSTEDPETLEEGEIEEEDEEEGECGFCLFMRGGGCRESFVAWENCVEEAEENKEDIAKKCFEITGALKKCMEAHLEYYAPILQAEKAAEAEVVREMEKEKEREREREEGEGEVVKEEKVLQKD